MTRDCTFAGFTLSEFPPVTVNPDPAVNAALRCTWVAPVAHAADGLPPAARLDSAPAFRHPVNWVNGVVEVAAPAVNRDVTTAVIIASAATATSRTARPACESNLIALRPLTRISANIRSVRRSAIPGQGSWHALSAG